MLEAERVLPLTERADPGSADLDQLDSPALAERFARADRAAFDATATDAVLRSLAAAAARVRAAQTIVLAGAGTSGRLAYFLACRHRAALAARGVTLVAWIAGGRRALAGAVEGAEDDVETARAELAPLLALRAPCLAGITCGLSAPCVAAGLEEATRRGVPSLVFGTNAVERARARPHPGLGAGFKGALDAALASGLCTAITPDPGPEVIAGSTRLKGGTATWLALDALLACLAAGRGDFEAAIAERMIAETARRDDAMRREAIAQAIELAGDALTAGGRVVYVGRGEPGLSGVLDAAECPPTFGACRDDVRAYLEGGWGALLAAGGDAAGPAEVADLERHHPLALGPGNPSAGPLAASDVAIELGAPAEPLLGGERASRIRLATTGVLDTKLALNAISSGAFVRAGKVFGNRMIDVVPSNAKLFERACGIVCEVARVTPEAAERALRVAIEKRRDTPWAPPARRPAGVVPLAVLVARGMPLSAARDALARGTLRDSLTHLGV